MRLVGRWPARHLGGVVFVCLLVSARSVGGQQLLADGVKDLADQIAASVTKEQKRKIAVIPFRELDNQATVLGTFLAEELTTRLFNAGGFDIVERTMLDKIMAELKLASSGAIDPETAKQIGRVAGVDAIVTGSITDLQSSVAVNCRVIDVQTGRVFAAAQARIVKDDDMRVIMGKPIEPTGPEQVPKKPKVAQRLVEQGFAFELHGCARSGSEVTCELMVTNQGAERELTLPGDDALRASSSDWSRAFDDAGNEYVTTEVRLANSSGGNARRSLIPGVATRAALVFQGVAPSAKWFRVLDVGCYVRRLTAGAAGGIGAILSDRALGGPFRVRFENVAIGR